MKKEKSCGTIIIENNKVLLIQQTDNAWGFPKGHVENNEKEQETAIRETKEEINIYLSEEDLELIGTQLYKKQFVDVFKTNKIINISNIKLQLDEVTEFKFVSKEEFIKMIENNEIVNSVANRYFMFKDAIDIDW